MGIQEIAYILYFPQHQTLNQIRNFQMYRSMRDVPWQLRENGARIRETERLWSEAAAVAEEAVEGGKQRKIKQRKNRVAGKRMRALSAGGNYSDYANSGSVPLLYPGVPQPHRLPAAVCAIFHR